MGRRKQKKQVKIQRKKISIMERKKPNEEKVVKEMSPEPEERVEPRVGDDYQAKIPTCRSRDEGSSQDSNREFDVLVWSPHVLPDEVVKEYLAKDKHGENASAAGHVPDDEEALFDLHVSNYDVREAEGLRRHKKIKEARRKRRFLLTHGAVHNYSEPFTREERERFEIGYMVYQKDFEEIQLRYLPHKTVREITAYHYRRKRAKNARIHRVNRSSSVDEVQTNAPRRRRAAARNGAGGSQDN